MRNDEEWSHKSSSDQELALRTVAAVLLEISDSQSEEKKSGNWRTL
jgi:hypothetical protein